MKNSYGSSALRINNLSYKVNIRIALTSTMKENKIHD